MQGVQRHKAVYKQIIKYRQMQILKTGLIYDPKMLGHKSKRKHPQTPQTIEVIVKLMEEHQLLSHPKIQYVPSVRRLALQSQLALAHQLKYVNYCTNLWAKSGNGTEIKVSDTYFNRKQEDAARIATGYLLEGIDKLLRGKWQNGFAVIRPPGHHSGAFSTINGFCIYNNIAIGANYIIQRRKKQKVAILDWDIHHGDGTQHIMQQNQKVLYISIHRYDRGKFYPAGDAGSYQNNGELAAKGTKLNIPLDFVDQLFKPYYFQAPGDNDYIYIFHRIVEPVLRQFNPEVILISSGFDAAIGDHLGEFTITPNGYHYLTRKVLYTNCSGQPIKQANLKQLCSLHPIVHKQLDAIIDFHSQFWHCLKNYELMSYTQKIKGNLKSVLVSSKINQHQINHNQVQKRKSRMILINYKITLRVQLVEGKSKEQVEQIQKQINVNPKKKFIKKRKQ